jgi:NitT/TauT family transport system permease protein
MKRRVPIFWGINAEPPKRFAFFLSILPFVLIALFYVVTSNIRNYENPADKVLPVFTKMTEGAWNAAKFEEGLQEEHRFLNFALTSNKKFGQLWTDTYASMRRIGTAMIISALLGLLVGINLGLLPGLQCLGMPILTFFSIIPPLSILPILFIMVGVDEAAKIILIFFGTFPMIARDTNLAVKKIPREQIIKALTLGASQIEVAYRVVLPQILPRLIDTVRLSMGSAWIYLISSEAIAANSGLGYRIFLVRRYMAMETIIPYVLWIVAIGYSIDWTLRFIVRWKFRWYLEAQD